VALWRHKCESGEGGVRSEELEEMKRKFNVKITELEAQLEAAQSKVSSLEKLKNRLQGELDDLTVEVERVSKSSLDSESLSLYVFKYH
jgi:peptidoglycan hydrolase CwlO-like protein